MENAPVPPVFAILRWQHPPPDTRILYAKLQCGTPVASDIHSPSPRNVPDLRNGTGVFPLLNYACYPAVPAKYIVPMVDVWEPTGQAISIMEELASEARDHSLLQCLAFYRKHHGKRMSRLLAWMLHHVRHGVVVDLLMEKLMRASENYPVRSYKTEKLKSENSASMNEEIEKREVCSSYLYR